MGADYYIFAETQINDQWVLIDPMYWACTDNSYTCAPAYQNGSRTFFGNTYHELRKYGRVCDNDVVQTMSPQLIECINKLYTWDGMSAEDRNRPYKWEGVGTEIFVVDFQTFKDTINFDVYDNNYFVPLHSSDDYEEIDSSNLLTAKEYMMLPKAIQKNFELRAWDDPYDYRYHFKEIHNNIMRHYEEFKEINYTVSQTPIRFFVLMNF